ncbi:hypothetical protein [Halobellus ordinarius]|uniref:hypothetical protein n=1 Tax=Halobellus ordinarius TaxID=3075120 RepID=UPI002880A43C|nr:hypothetical protein [Halobellus sp. ZY16]
MPARDPDDRESYPPTDPRRIRALAVTTEDVVDAFEASVRGGRELVLRVTPPFSGRMRARLHAVDVVESAAHSGATAEGGRDAGDKSAAETGDAGDGSAAETGDAGDGTGDDTAETAPIHLPPERFLSEPPSYPTVDDTEDALRDSETPYTPERHRKRHQRAVDAWRTAVRERFVEEVTLETDGGPHTVAVSYLG